MRLTKTGRAFQPEAQRLLKSAENAAQLARRVPFAADLAAGVGAAAGRRVGWAVPHVARDMRSVGLLD